MAKTSGSSAVIFLLSVVAISLLLTCAMARSDRSRIGVRSLLFGGPGPVGPICHEVHGVESGETCSDVTDAARLTKGSFDLLNPNLNCGALFIGQWLCIRGIP
ncbi:hypothetical protein BT93_E2438 [Corymbia citriodora subsp. variegata]|nr:hypothetical protein BT93_E2438 [Corymbia citriodora subsp. variegata]